MIHWIFDLDNTLYRIEPKKFRYELLNSNYYLNNKIKNLVGKKVLYTNGNLNHTLNCMEIMEMNGLFHKICCREITGMKPYLNSYVSLYHQSKIGLNDTCYFFEDTPINLVQAKKFNWVTILISDESSLNIKKKYPEIDYIFPDIIDAINYFTLRNNN